MIANFLSFNSKHNLNIRRRFDIIDYDYKRRKFDSSKVHFVNTKSTVHIIIT